MKINDKGKEKMIEKQKKREIERQRYKVGEESLDVREEVSYKDLKYVDKAQERIR